MHTILAKIGATTHQGTIIQESTIRGVISQGMLCSPLELGISSEQGIVDLPPNSKLGLPLKDIPKDQLSSIPWWNYQLVEKFFIDNNNNAIVVQRAPFNEAMKNYMLVSETYWFNGEYHYRQLQ